MTTAILKFSVKNLLGLGLKLGLGLELARLVSNTKLKDYP